MEPKEKKAFEPSGLVPRSIVRTFERFRQQLLPGSETAAIREYRISRYQVLVSARCLFTLLTIPIATNWLVSNWLLSPLIEHFWNTQQNEIFLNSYQEERAFAELEFFSERLFFESLLQNTNFNESENDLLSLRKYSSYPVGNFVSLPSEAKDASCTSCTSCTSKGCNGCTRCNDYPEGGMRSETWVKFCNKQNYAGNVCVQSKKFNDTLTNDLIKRMQSESLFLSDFQSDNPLHMHPYFLQTVGLHTEESNTQNANAAFPSYFVQSVGLQPRRYSTAKRNFANDSITSCTSEGCNGCTGCTGLQTVGLYSNGKNLNLSKGRITLYRTNEHDSLVQTFANRGLYSLLYKPTVCKPVDTFFGQDTKNAEDFLLALDKSTPCNQFDNSALSICKACTALPLDPLWLQSWSEGALPTKEICFPSEAKDTNHKFATLSFARKGLQTYGLLPSEAKDPCCTKLAKESKQFQEYAEQNAFLQTSGLFLMDVHSLHPMHPFYLQNSFGLALLPLDPLHPVHPVHPSDVQDVMEKTHPIQMKNALVTQRFAKGYVNAQSLLLPNKAKDSSILYNQSDNSYVQPINGSPLFTTCCKAETNSKTISAALVQNKIRTLQPVLSLHSFFGSEGSNAQNAVQYPVANLAKRVSCASCTSCTGCTGCTGHVVSKENNKTGGPFFGLHASFKREAYSSKAGVSLVKQVYSQEKNQLLAKLRFANSKALRFAQQNDWNSSQEVSLIEEEINSLKIKEQIQDKILQLAVYYNQQTILSITNIVGDIVSLFTLGFLFIWMKPEITILKSFLIEAIYSLSDTTKSFLLILLTDLLVGFHSPRGWETALELLLKHFGLPENQDFVFLFVATFPVLLDTVFKYWIFRHLNKISPSTVATYHSMIE